MRDDFGGGNIVVNCGQGFVGLAMFGFLIYYLIVMSQTLGKISPRNRDMEPGMVFLGLIPCFNLVWLFFIVNAVAGSLEKEYRKRGLAAEGDFGKNIGLIGNILNCTICCSIGWVICAIMHLLKVNEYVKRLDNAKKRIREDDDEDEVDDRPRKGRTRDDDDEDDDRPRKRKRRDDDE